MAKVSANYEVVYIVDPALGEEGIAAMVAKFKTLAEQHSSAVEVEEWGSRKLAYPIDYKTEGYYVLMSFTSEPSFPRSWTVFWALPKGSCVPSSSARASKRGTPC